MQEYRELAEKLFSRLECRHPRPPRADMEAALRGEMAVLRLLYEETYSMTAGEISRRLAMKTPRIAAVLNALEKKNLIVRQADTKDKRRVLVTITQEGRVLCREKREQAVSDMAELLFALGMEDAQHLLRITAKMQEVLDRKCAALKEKEEKADE